MSDSASWRAAFGGGGSAVYEEVLGPRVFVPWAELLLDRLAPKPGEALLDVACGPGNLTRIAAELVGSSGRVTGADLSATMLAIAAAKPSVPGGAAIDYVECPADALAVDDRAYDIVTCQQGLQFFPDRPTALAEMRRAARPGARLGIAIWRPIEECPLFATVAAAVSDVLGAVVAAEYRRGPWGWSETGEIAAAIESAGFSHVDATTDVLQLEFEGGAEQLAATLGASPIGPRVAELDDGGRADLVAAVAALGAEFVDDGSIRAATASTIVRAVA